MRRPNLFRISEPKYLDNFLDEPSYNSLTQVYFFSSPNSLSLSSYAHKYRTSLHNFTPPFFYLLVRRVEAENDVAVCSSIIDHPLPPGFLCEYPFFVSFPLSLSLIPDSDLYPAFTPPSPCIVSWLLLPPSSADRVGTTGQRTAITLVHDHAVTRVRKRRDGRDRPVFRTNFAMLCIYTTTTDCRVSLS